MFLEDHILVPFRRDFSKCFGIIRFIFINYSIINILLAVALLNYIFDTFNKKRHVLFISTFAHILVPLPRAFVHSKKYFVFSRKISFFYIYINAFFIHS